MKKRFFILILTFILLLTACTPPADPVYRSQPQAISGVKVHYIDIGQGDAILIQSDTANMLIDAGGNQDAQEITTYLQDQGITKLDICIGTHPHEDHIGGMDAVVQNFQIGEIIMPQITANTKTFTDLIQAIKDKNLQITTPKAGMTFTLGNAQCTILAPNSTEYEDTNDYSVVLRLTYGDTSFLFTGDAQKKSEKEMLKKGYDLTANVLKVGHHGSHSSTSQNFLKAVNPQYAVISCGKDNDYKHPHKETLDLLNENNIQIQRTDLQGTIICISDGKTIHFE